MCIFVYMWTCVQMPKEAKEGANLWGLKFPKVVSHRTWVLGTEPRVFTLFNIMIHTTQFIIFFILCLFMI